MRVQKAVITAAGPGQNGLPLQRLVDRDGVEKTALEMIIEEIDSSGIDSVAIVIRPDDRDAYAAAAGRYVDRISFVIQDEPRGYGDALLRAKSFMANQPVLHLVGDHLYLSRIGKSCAQQLIEAAESEQCAVSAVQPTREHMLPYFGTVGGNRLPRSEHLYEVRRVIEKPTPTLAEQELTISGFRSGTYLCFFGMHVLTPGTMEILAELAERNPKRSIALAEALNELAARERFLACEIAGSRYNIGMKYGLLTAQLAFSLSGVDRDRVLTELVELLAQQNLNSH
jgi:UTP--glucose-1-phosphate uridylyltransferase